MNYRQEMAIEFAKKVKSLGFRAYLAYTNEYGIITDSVGQRVLCFGSDFRGINLSGNYLPSKGSGTGWKISDSVPATDTLTADYITRALQANAPSWANNKPVYTTLAQHLDSYGSSSKYVELEG